MLCKIADLIVEVPEAGDLFPRCQAYLTDEQEPDILLQVNNFRLELWQNFTRDFAIYAESGLFFHLDLLDFNGITLHASAVELDGKAYLFSAPSGTGKSTHTQLWQSVFGEKNALIFNDDKPALRNMDGIWYAYGTPWSGHGGNLNRKVPLAGICFLKQAQENRIRRLDNAEAVQKIIWQTRRRFNKQEKLNLMLSRVDELVRQIPIFELENRPEPEAAWLSYETMRKAAEEMGL